MMSSPKDVSSKIFDLAEGSPIVTLPSSSVDLAASIDAYGDDIVGWLNDMLDNPAAIQDGDDFDVVSPTDLKDLDKTIQHLSTRLDVAAQDTSSQLETSFDDISRTVPRLAYDLQFLRESALSLQQSLASIEKARHSREKASQQTVNNAEVSLSDKPSPAIYALERLHHLDTVKTAMERTHAVLREAESWSSLDAEITSLISTQSYGPAATRLSEASNSLSLFSNTPEYETRRALMISLQNQLEAALSSALVAAINKLEITKCKSYYGIFTDIQREVEFRNYYFGSRRKRLLDLWTNAKPSDCEGEGGTAISGSEEEESTKLVSILRSFFSAFTTLLGEERLHVTAIFPDPQPTISTFIQSTIDALNPPLAQRLSSMADHYGALALPHLIKTFKLAEEFAISTEKLMENVGYSAGLSPLTPGGADGEGGGAPGLRRRSSKRMSLSRRLGTGRSSIGGPQGLGGPVGGTVAWEQALFEPFVDFQSDYLTLEKKYLDEALKTVVSSSSKAKGDTSIADGARILRERSAAVFELAEETLERCMTFTHGYGAVGLLQSIDHVFSSLLEVSKVQLLSPSKTSSLKQTSKTSSKGAAATGGGGDGFEELDYTPEDWEAFQESLHLLETCRAMRDRLGTLEAKIKNTLIQFAGMVQLSRVDPSGLYISGTTKGEVQLLMQSTLNSAELQTILDSLLRDSQSFTPSATPSIRPQPSQQLDPSSRGFTLLKAAQSSVTMFTQATQVFLQNIILLPLHRQLAGYASLSVWSSQQRSAGKGSAAAAYELQMPTFSLSHSSTIQMVSDGLLNLPRLFEVYADDDALTFSLETLPFVDSASLRALMANSAGPANEEIPPSPTPKLRRLSSASSSTSVASMAAQPSKAQQTIVLTPEMVSSTWLSSLALSLLSHLTMDILPAIRSLSPDGAAQLASDLGYLSNIVRALNVEWEELEKWREYSELKDAEGRKKFREMANGGMDGMDSVWKLIAKLRGWID